MTKSIYLDHAAATPLTGSVLDAMKPYFSEKFYNPSATYLQGRAMRTELQALRAAAAVVLGAKPAEIVFTSGATEANNLAIKGVHEQYPDAKILFSAVEHASVIEPASRLGAKIIAVDEKGNINTSQLKSLIDEQTVLISVMLVNNEIGSVQPLGEVAKIIAEEKASRQKNGNKLPLYLHTDAVQATNYLDLHVSRLAVDFMSLNGAKIYGPKGVGLLYIRAGTSLTPQITGGGQELGWRSGTENMPLIAGFVRALHDAQSSKDLEAIRIRAIRETFETGLRRISDSLVINGGKNRAPHIVSATFAKKDNETLMMRLDEAGIEVAVGSACKASSDQPSHVLTAIGLNDEQAHATIRFSFGHGSNLNQIDTILNALSKILKS